MRCSRRGKDWEGEKGKWYHEEGAFKGLNYSSYLSLFIMEVILKP